MSKPVTPDVKIAKLEKTVADLERACDKLEEMNRRLEHKTKAQEHQLAELFAAQENAELYGNYKECQRLEADRDQWKRLYEHRTAALSCDNEALLSRLAAAQEHKHNERGAGRKPVLSRESVLKLKEEHPKMSLRAMAVFLGVSPSTVSRALSRL